MGSCTSRPEQVRIQRSSSATDYPEMKGFSRSRAGRPLPNDRLVALMADNMEPLSDVTAETMAAEVRALGKTFRFDTYFSEPAGALVDAG
jgi:hypothetical protein